MERLSNQIEGTLIQLLDDPKRLSKAPVVETHDNILHRHFILLFHIEILFLKVLIQRFQQKELVIEQKQLTF